MEMNTMRKRILALIMTAATLCSLFTFGIGSAAAATTLTEDSGVVQTVRALGIITGGSDGNMDLSANVTRAQFAKMMIAASTYHDSIGDDGAGFSLFSDVKSSSWASEYIRIAVNEGWFVGYTDGTFRPNNSITLEEACTAVLRMLGYDSSTLAGSYPTAQLSKAYALGLRDGITTSRGETMTRSECAYLFYNLMTATNSSGTVYAKSLGYSLTSGGEIDYSSVVESRMSGPFVVASGSSIAGGLPFSSSNVTVYRDGKTSTLGSSATYDVYYYSQDLRTVWVYDTKASGTYTAASPSTASPTSVTVGGNSYTIDTSTAAYKLSSFGPFSIGDSVTLLLGMDGSVVDVVTSSSADSVYYGIVTASGSTSYTDSSNTVVASKYVKVACTDGVERQFYTSNTYTVGSLVSYSVSGSKVQSLSSRSISGTVNSAGTKIGSYTLASDVNIIDADSDGNWGKVYASAFAGKSVPSNSVSYYATNASGEVTDLILNDATGNIYTYGYLTSVSNVSSDTSVSVSGVYSYIINGTAGTLNLSGRMFSVTTGGALFKYESGAISGMSNLNSITLSSLANSSAVSNSTTYALADGVQVYLRNDSTYTVSNVSTVSDTSVYSLKGYYDSYALGGKIRVIIATVK